MGKKKAFTLAEVLLTLTVVGIIASLTIPAMIQGTQDAEFYSAYKDTYQAISQATRMMQNDNAGSLGGFATGNDIKNQYITFY